jgi:hypothetical protein
MHLHDGELQGLLDRELGGSEEESLRAHVAVCEQCVARMKAMKSAFRETGQLLTALDASPPAMSADQLIEIAQRRHIPARRTPRGIAWAASVAGLVIATVVAAAIPGSPVRTIVQNLLEELGPESFEPIAPAIARIEVRGDSIGFAVGDRSIQVENQNATASYRITLPDNLSQTVIRVGMRTIFAKQGSRVLQNEFDRDGESYRLAF